MNTTPTPTRTTHDIYVFVWSTVVVRLLLRTQLVPNMQRVHIYIFFLSPQREKASFLHLKTEYNRGHVRTEIGASSLLLYASYSQ